MFVSGFTFVRNAVKFDYPVVPSLLSILPLCDEVVVAVGDSDDGTRQLIEDLHEPKIRIIDTVWDPALRAGGAVLAVETNKALAAINPQADWALYIQADELIHEEDHPRIRQAMEDNLAHSHVEGLLFHYKHFYGNYSYLGDARRWYPKEVRVIRPRIGLSSYRDAQGFRRDGQKVRVKDCGAHIYHYGWVKPPEKQGLKREFFESLYNKDISQELQAVRYQWDYTNKTRLKPFTGTHPAPMRERVAQLNWDFDYDPKKAPYSLKERFHKAAEKLLGHRIFEFRNYLLLK